MNIVVFGAGAIGSLFGGLLSKQNNVILVGRKDHINAIKKKGLTIKGLTSKNIKINAFESVTKIDYKIDLLILTVKSYDTKQAINDAKPIINSKTLVFSLQNGLGNVEIISKVITPNNIIAGSTTHGALFSKPGIITHTGYGRTVIGELNCKKTSRIKQVINQFNTAGIKTELSNNIIQEIWKKAIINSSINPLTTIFNCKNGYLQKNPILARLVETVCIESTNIARSNNIALNQKNMINITKEVIRTTADNYSSMHQSYYKNKKTEVDSINGKLLEIAKKNNISSFLNEYLTYCIKKI